MRRPRTTRHTNRPVDRPRRDAYARDRRRDRDASSGWREEYNHAHVPLPDGGERYALPPPGATVRDRESDGDELLVVEALADARADTYHIDETGQTVHDHNPTYQAESPVVIAVYRDAVAAIDGWRSVEDLRDAVAFGAVEPYAFPAARLERVDDADTTPRRGSA